MARPATMVEERTERLYDEVEVSRLLHRAAEIDASRDAARSVGLSLKEIEKVAAEAGIDAGAVRAAAVELDAAVAQDERVNVWGGPLRLTVARIVNVPVAETMWESLVAEIRRTYGNPGRISEWGQAAEWTYDGQDAVTVHVSVSAVEGGTKIQAFWNQPVLAAPVYVISSFVAVIGGLGLVTNLGLGLPYASALFAAILAAMFMVARFTLSKLAARQKRRLQSLVGRLERIAREESAEPVTDAEKPANRTGAAAGRRVPAGSEAPRFIDVDRTLAPEAPESIGPRDEGSSEQSRRTAHTPRAPRQRG